MSKCIFSRAAKLADYLLWHINDHLSGNKSRRDALHLRASEIANEVRRRRWVHNHAKASQRLGQVPYGHRLMLNLRARYFRLVT
ncbi:hypothetical protein [Aeromonas enteropelogenes]|uniref:hypothetical protein n=1 Tax=Aeromonas enteropelogenes TaxID=29489 RepID=UPI002285CAFA|nr:hypothetical protein [Aeromonas enteropelogenes]MCZ0750084.1 hypothetical protein [Aeromonas enteropelogenes]